MVNLAELGIGDNSGFGGAKVSRSTEFRALSPVGVSPYLAQVPSMPASSKILVKGTKLAMDE